MVLWDHRPPSSGSSHFPSKVTLPCHNIYCPVMQWIEFGPSNISTIHCKPDIMEKNKNHSKKISTIQGHEILLKPFLILHPGLVMWILLSTILFMEKKSIIIVL